MKTAKATTAKRVRWTVTEYFRMAEVGLFDDRRVELINGEIIEVPAQATPHRAAITNAMFALTAVFPKPPYWLLTQATLRLSRHDAPDPDFHVFEARVGTPDDQLPLPLLVIEVSDTTYGKDSGPKLRLYASAGITDYWIVNIPQRRVEVYRRPENPTPGRRSGWRYADVTHFKPGDTLHPLARPDIDVAVDSLLP